MTGGDQRIAGGRLRASPLPRRIAKRHADGTFLVAILAGADFTGQFVEPVNAVQLNLGRGEKFKARGERGPGAEQNEGQSEGKSCL